MENEQEYEPVDGMTAAKDETLELEKVGPYTRCKVHGLRVNGEAFCSQCDYKMEPNCQFCGELKEAAFSVNDTGKFEERVDHANCKPSGGFWMESTVCSTGNDGDPCRMPTCEICGKKYE